MSARDILDYSDRFHPLTQHMVADRDVIQVAAALVRCGVAPNLVAGIVAELTVNVPSDASENRMGPPARAQSAAMSDAERARLYRSRKKQPPSRNENVTNVTETPNVTPPTVTPVDQPDDIPPLGEDYFDDTIGDDVTDLRHEQRHEQRHETSVTQVEPKSEPLSPSPDKIKERSPRPPKENKNSPLPLSPSASLRSAAETVVSAEISVTKSVTHPDRDLLGKKLEKPEKPDAIVFKLAKVIFGANGGGLAKKVLEATKNNIPAALEILGEAKRAGDPRSYLAGILNRLAVPDDDMIRPNYKSLPYEQMTYAERKQHNYSW